MSGGEVGSCVFGSHHEPRFICGLGSGLNKTTKRFPMEAGGPTLPWIRHVLSFTCHKVQIFLCTDAEIVYLNSVKEQYTVYSLLGELVGTSCAGWARLQNLPPSVILKSGTADEPHEHLPRSRRP